jgi:type IV secretory pathway TrbL component
MINLEDDPVLGRFFNTPEKKAKWIVRLKYAYILWIIFVILGILSLLIWSFLK